MPNNNGLTYDELFAKYLASIGTGAGDLVLPRLKISKASTNSRMEITVSEEWQKGFTSSVRNASRMYSELKPIPTESDRIVLPNLISNLGSPHNLKTVRWLGESIDDNDDLRRIEVGEETRKRWTLTPQPIEVNIQVSEYINRAENMNHIIGEIIHRIAQLIDASVISPVSYMKNNPIESILDTEGVYDHESLGMNGVAGYIDNTDTNLKNFNPETIKNTLFHLPAGYRQKAKWIMNSETAVALEDMQFQVNHGDKDRADNWSPFINNRLLNKPVIINEYMPSKGVIIILADLTRGYQISRYFEDMYFIVTPYSIGLKFKVAGKVLQPAAFKGVRCTYAYEIPNIDYSLVDLKTEYDEDGNEVLY